MRHAFRLVLGNSCALCSLNFDTVSALSYCISATSFDSAVACCCCPSGARTDLSPLSPTQTFNTSLFSVTARIGFSDASRILRRILPHFSDNRTTALPVVGTALSFMGPHPWLFFFHVSLGPIPGCFSFSGPWVPSLAVFLAWSLSPVRGCFPPFTSMWHVFHQTFHSPSG